MNGSREYFTCGNARFSNIPQQKLRQKLLRQYRLLEVSADEGFRRLVAVAARVFKVPIAVASFMTEERNVLWVKHGFEIPDPLHSESLCSFTYLDEKAPSLVFRDTLCIPAIANHPRVIGPFGLRFYAGANIFLDNVKVGNFCIADYQPRQDFSAEDEALLVEMAECMAVMIVSQHQRWIQERWYDFLLPFRVLHSVEDPLQSVNTHLQRVFDVYTTMRPQSLPAAFLDIGSKKSGWSSAKSPTVEQENVRLESNAILSPDYLQQAVQSLDDDVLQLGEAIEASLYSCMICLQNPPAGQEPKKAIQLTAPCRSGCEDQEHLR